MTFAPLVVAGVAAVCAGGLLASRRLSFPVGLAVQAAGCLLLAVAGILGARRRRERRRAVHERVRAPRSGVDPLTGLFLGVLGVVAAASLAFAIRYLAPIRKRARDRRHSRRCSCSPCRCSSSSRATR